MLLITTQVAALICLASLSILRRDLHQIYAVTFAAYDWLTLMDQVGRAWVE
jgi:hypothetical protein